MIKIELSDSEGEQEKIVVPHKTVKVKSTIAVKTQENTYEYDKYDIIDFLEPDYIDWLNSIPLECWDKYKKDVEKSFYKITDERVMDLVITKVKINLPKYVVDNFEKITLEVLKYCVKTNFTKLNTQIKKNEYNFIKCIRASIGKNDLEFNRYFYGNLYFKLEPTHQYHGLNTENNFIFLKGIYIHKSNIFYKQLKEHTLSYCRELSNYELIKYFNSIFPNIFQSNLKEIKMGLYEMYVMIFNKSKINNWNDMIELKNILNISDIDFCNEVLISKYFGYYKYKNLMNDICKSGNVELVFKTLNNFWFDKFKNIDIIIPIMVYSSLSKNYELVLLLYNFFTFEKNIKFDTNICSRIVNKIIDYSDKKYHEYDKIIYEWFNLGGVVKGYPIYTDYIESIKKKIK